MPVDRLAQRSVGLALAAQIIAEPAVELRPRRRARKSMRLDLVGDHVVGHVLVGPPAVVGRHAAWRSAAASPLFHVRDRLLGIGHEVPRGRVGPHAGVAQHGHGHAADAR